MFELPKDTFIIDHENEVVRQILDQNEQIEDSQYKVAKKRLKLGEFSTSSMHWINRGTMNFFRDNPNLKIRDERIIKEIKRQKESGVFNGLYRNFNDRGDFINHKDQNTNAYAEGLMTPKRIAPRKFQGLIVGLNLEILYEEVAQTRENVSDEELYERTKKLLQGIKINDPEVIQKHFENLVQKVVQTMLDACQNHPERIVPVYDIFGNLLWPQKISRDQILKTRDKKEL